MCQDRPRLHSTVCGCLAHRGASGGCDQSNVRTAVCPAQTPRSHIAVRCVDSRLLAAAALVWSVTTALQSLANGFWALLLLRLLLGVAEAFAGPQVYSLVTDLFPPHQRGKAVGVYAGGVYLGGALASTSLVFVKAVGWRDMAIILGCVGVLISVTFGCAVREPRRVRCCELCRGGCATNAALLQGAFDMPPLAVVPTAACRPPTNAAPHQGDAATSQTKSSGECLLPTQAPAGTFAAGAATLQEGLDAGANEQRTSQRVPLVHAPDAQQLQHPKVCVSMPHVKTLRPVTTGCAGGRMCGLMSLTTSTHWHGHCMNPPSDGCCWGPACAISAGTRLPRLHHCSLSATSVEMPPNTLLPMRLWFVLAAWCRRWAEGGSQIDGP